MKINKIKINSKSKNYSIIIGTNIIKDISKILHSNKIDFKKCLIIIDNKVPKRFKLNLINFKITDAQGGSLRVYVSKNPKINHQRKISNQLSMERKKYKLFNINTYKKFKEEINACKNKLNKILIKFNKKNYKIAGYGAAAKTTTLLNYFKLSEKSNIKFIFDDNKLKHGLCIPGTSIKILNPNKLNFKNIDILIIFAWNYSDVIIKNIRKNKNFKKIGGKFLVPFPKPKII